MSVQMFPSQSVGDVLTVYLPASVRPVRVGCCVSDKLLAAHRDEWEPLSLGRAPAASFSSNFSALSAEHSLGTLPHFATKAFPYGSSATQMLFVYSFVTLKGTRPRKG